MAASQTDHSFPLFPYSEKDGCFSACFQNNDQLSQSDAPPCHSANKFTLRRAVLTSFCHKHFVLSLQSFIFQDVYYSIFHIILLYMFEVFREGHELTCPDTQIHVLLGLLVFPCCVLTAPFSTFYFQQSSRKSLRLVPGKSLTML